MATRLSRRSIARHVAEQLVDGAPARKVLQEVASYLIETRRTNEVDLIVRDIHYYLAERGIVMAKVSSAFQLEATTKKAIEQFIKAETKAQSVMMTEVVDRTLLGGVKIDVPDKQLDQTVLHTLTKLRTTFKKA